MLYLNLYKFGIMINGQKYPIFPWSSNPHYTNSSKLWLISHLTISLIVVIFTGFLIFKRIKLVDFDNYPNMTKLYRIFVFLFFVLIIFNIHRFNNLSLITSIIANSIPLILAIYSYTIWLEDGFCFYVVITIPIVLECLLQISNV